MHIDWAALGVVAVVSIATSVIFTILLATGIRLSRPPRSNRTRAVPVPQPSPSGTSCLASRGCWSSSGFTSSFRNSTRALSLTTGKSVT